MGFIFVAIFIISCLILFFSSRLVVSALTRIARFLGWKEFVVALFVMAFAASLPNLFVGISSAIHKIPQLSFGDVVGGNVVDLTLVIALATLVSKGLSAESRTVQSSSIFTMVIAILPLLLVLDGVLSRGDGIILILVFIFYVFWLFSKKERFSKVYNGKDSKAGKGFKFFTRDLGGLILGIIFLLLSAEGIVRSASFFATALNLQIALIGILIVGLGNCLPEACFAISLAKKGQSWMILGDLMGAVIVPATLVLGVVSLIYPIEISDFSPFAIARIFLVISALFFFFFVRTNQKISKKEAIFLLLIYILFVVVEILTK